MVFTIYSGEKTIMLKKYSKEIKKEWISKDRGKDEWIKNYIREGTSLTNTHKEGIRKWDTRTRNMVRKMDMKYEESDLNLGTRR